MRVGLLLRAQVLTCAPTDTLTIAARSMREHRVSALAVRAGQHTVAMIAERDLVRAMADGVDPDIARVQAYAAPVRETADPMEDSRQVTQRLLDTGLEHIAVLDGTTVINVLSLRQLIAVEPCPAPRPARPPTSSPGAALRAPVRAHVAGATPAPSAGPHRTAHREPARAINRARRADRAEQGHVGDAGWWLETRRRPGR